MKLALLAVLLLAGCATVPELTVIVGPRRQNTGEQDVAASFMLVQRIGRRAVVGCLHQSEPSHGAPFNGDDESTFDSCGFGARWGGNVKH